MKSLDQAIRAAIADENRRFMADPEAIADAQADGDLYRRRLEGSGGVLDPGPFVRQTLEDKLLNGRIILKGELSVREPLVRAEVRTHNPSKYTLHNSEDGTVWQMTATGSWTAKEIR